MVASTDPGWLQTAFNTLTGLFDRVGLKKCQENRGDGVPPIPDGRGTGRQSLYPEDDGDGEELQGATVGVGELPGVREGLGKGITGCAPPNPARRGEWGTGAGGR